MVKKMQAVILAAGMGKRLGDLTKSNTKCMVEVNGICLIERMLSILDKKGLSRIVVVIGYEGEKLKKFIGTLNISVPICYVENKAYDRTNNIFSLALASEYLREEDTLLLESDLIFEEALIDCMLKDKRDTLVLVDKFENGMDGTCLILDAEDNIVDFISGKFLDYDEKNSYFKTVNIYKFSKKFSSQFYLPFLKAYISTMGDNEYYESVIKFTMLVDKSLIKAKRLEKREKWYEIDDKQDLDIAETLFIEDQEMRYERMVKRFGGYWRFPHLLDFCYLVNPYFPSKRMIKEISSNTEQLITQYPSGMKENCLLASKNFGIHEEHLVVGNGAAELIKELLEQLEGKTGIISPTFEEYPNRYGKCDCIIMDVSEMDFIYHSSDVISFFSSVEIHNLVVINPDNPSGNYMDEEECEEIALWCEQQGINFILDESFIDFAEGNLQEHSAIKEEFLQKYPNTYVIKSISKSYGVPGLRLGIMASIRSDIIAVVKKRVSIWNINSYAEFFMQILGKYEQEYSESLECLKRDRKILYEQLLKIKGLKVYPSQANYLMCEVVNGTTSKNLVGECLKRDILVKDLSDKIKNGRQYIRIAVRTQVENNKLVDTLEQIL